MPQAPSREFLLCASTTLWQAPSARGTDDPHLMRLLLGPDMRKILPLSAVGGACLLLFADVLGRILGRPGELESGIVTALIGARYLFLSFGKRR